MPEVLVLDEDCEVERLVRDALRDLPIEISAAGSPDAGLAAFQERRPDAVLLDMYWPGLSGLALFQQIRDLDERVPIIFLTDGSESEMAIEATKLGALDFLLKPLDAERARQLIEQALEIRRLMETPVELPQADRPPGGEHELIGKSSEMLEVYKAIGRVASQPVTVLILGESGTGKELIARAIYHHGDRQDKPFLAVNCAALPDSLLESELFGHEKGAFTGADHRRIGKFEQCNGGTIFLDEVGDMSPLVQSKLLRLLQEQKFERVGGNTTIETDVRIITATNRNLETMTEEGTFRPDLYYRLNGFTIALPPLRERGDDLQLLIEVFLARYSQSLNKPLQLVSPEAMQALLDYSWPGNVRELQSVLRKALLNMTGPVLVPEFLPAEVRPPVAALPLSLPNLGDATAPAPGNANGNGALPFNLEAFLAERMASSSDKLYSEAIAFVDRFVLTRVLQATGGNQSKAAKILGITRGSLRNKTQALGIRIDQVVSPPAGSSSAAEKNAAEAQ
jgi:DNA-binding NtrC family response regulator